MQTFFDCPNPGDVFNQDQVITYFPIDFRKLRLRMDRADSDELLMECLLSRFFGAGN